MKQLNLPFPKTKYKDMELATCISCGKGIYAAETLQNDWSGILNCTECGDYTAKWVTISRG